MLDRLPSTLVDKMFFQQACNSIWWMNSERRIESRCLWLVCCCVDMHSSNNWCSNFGIFCNILVQQCPWAKPMFLDCTSNWFATPINYSSLTKGIIWTAFDESLPRIVAWPTAKTLFSSTRFAWFCWVYCHCNVFYRFTERTNFSWEEASCLRRELFNL